MFGQRGVLKHHQAANNINALAVKIINQPVNVANYGVIGAILFDFGGGGFLPHHARIIFKVNHHGIYLSGGKKVLQIGKIVF